MTIYFRKIFEIREICIFVIGKARSAFGKIIAFWNSGWKCGTKHLNTNMLKLKLKGFLKDTLQYEAAASDHQ